MSFSSEQVLLRVYLQNADRTPFAPTHERIVKAARHAKLAGATVLRGILGAGYHAIHSTSHWSISEHVPVIVELVDTAENIARFIHGPLEEIMVGGLITLERAAVILYRDKPSNQANTLSLAQALKPLSTLPRINPGNHMTITENGVLLRVFIGESDQHQHKPLYQAIVQKIRELGLAGATVLRGSEGFGANSVVHKAAILAMSSDLPIIIEIVDTEEKINLLLPWLESMVLEGMVTMEYVMIVLYRHGGAAHSMPPVAPNPAP